MAWEFTYRCDGCGESQRVRTGDYRFYDAPRRDAGAGLFDGVPCSDQTGWCRRCRRLRSIESIPDMQLLERMKQALTDSDVPPTDEHRSRLARLEDRIRWREARKSPPKCFTCGSTEVEPIEEATLSAGFTHPGCGGRFRIGEDPSHIQPMYALLIPAEGPRGRWRFEWPGRWFRRGSSS